jgi:hypothetical protein
MVGIPSPCPPPAGEGFDALTLLSGGWYRG